MVQLLKKIWSFKQRQTWKHFHATLTCKIFSQVTNESLALRRCCCTCWFCYNNFVLLDRNIFEMTNQRGTWDALFLIFVSLEKDNEIVSTSRSMHWSSDINGNHSDCFLFANCSCDRFCQSRFSFTMLHRQYWIFHHGSIVDVISKNFTTQKDCLKYKL